jgi:MerR family transcriptional regulator, light-induced transcriptional regulator
MTTPDFQRPRHPIRVVAQRTGITLETLRAWERRYGAVQPGRTEGQQRLYSDADIERLQLLRQVTQSGWSIGHVATLEAEQLRELLGEDLEPPRNGKVAGGGWIPGVPLVGASMEAIRRLDAAALEGLLRQGMMVLGVLRFVEELVLPVLQEVGLSWERGELGIAHEHLASAVVRRVLGEQLGRSGGPASAGVMVAATLPGQMHELGVLIAAVTATAAGWRVVYLGADTPAEDIASAVRETRAHVAAIGLIYPVDDERLPGELRRLRTELPPEVVAIAGGAAAAGLSGLLESLGYRVITDMPSLYGLLTDLKPATAGGG